MVTSHAIALPASQGISVLPSGRLLSSLTRPDGSLTDGTLAVHRARQTRSLTSWWRAILPKAKRQERAWVPLASAVFPQGQSSGVQRSAPSLKPTAILTASLSRRVIVIILVIIICVANLCTMTKAYSICSYRYCSALLILTTQLFFCKCYAVVDV